MLLLLFFLCVSFSNSCTKNCVRRKLFRVVSLAKTKCNVFANSFSYIEWKRFSNKMILIVIVIWQPWTSFIRFFLYSIAANGWRQDISQVHKKSKFTQNKNQRNSHSSVSHKFHALTAWSVAKACKRYIIKCLKKETNKPTDISINLCKSRTMCSCFVLLRRCYDGKRYTIVFGCFFCSKIGKNVCQFISKW